MFFSLMHLQPIGQVLSKHLLVTLNMDTRIHWGQLPGVSEKVKGERA